MHQTDRVAEEPLALQLAMLRLLFPHGPFFSGDTAGFQGVPARHVFLAATVSLFADLGRPLRLLEIGSWTGSSALTFAQAIEAFCPANGSILCVDPWGRYLRDDDVGSGAGGYSAMDALGRTGLARALFLHNTGFGPPGVPIDSRQGLSSAVLPTLAGRHFDIVHIDGSHYVDDVTADIRAAQVLLADGGILCGDDLELQGFECDIEQVRTLVDRDYVVDLQGRAFHPGVTVAVHDGLGPVSCYSGFWVMRKTGARYEPVDLRGRDCIVPDHFDGAMKRDLIRQLAALKGAAPPG